MGVRPLRRVIEQEIRDKITDFTLITLMLNTLKLIWLTENSSSAKNKCNLTPISKHSLHSSTQTNELSFFIVIAKISQIHQ